MSALPQDESNVTDMREFLLDSYEQFKQVDGQLHGYLARLRSQIFAHEMANSSELVARHEAAEGGLSSGAASGALSAEEFAERFLMTR